ncbi:MAG: hypothetical protein QOG56_596 [Solirubrobacteraceae bacterium]|nr:hypothetical protein [Solirubrobacteraceae bacterium]
MIEPALKRAPRGYPADHPRIEHLKRKHVTVFARHELGPWLHESQCAELVRRQLDATRPLVRWLTEQVGPSTLPRARR